MKIPVENKILAGFVVTALALGIMGWLSYRATAGLHFRAEMGDPFSGGHFTTRSDAGNGC